jgi:thioredoxin reductase
MIVKATGVNPSDWKIAEGYMQQMIQLQFPSTLGTDFSGVVKQIGGKELANKGYIKKYEEGKTSLEGVFVAGDVYDYEYRRAITAT